ncbi:MAG TPA: hypothetical protein VNB94_05535, partial [Mycobacteriales bacterium]|nr:hypothetical protein [Mycobacteriales bacterium]
VAALEAPERLAARAAELGLVPAGPPAFLRLSDGAVLGAPLAPAAPVIEVAPPPPANPTPAATRAQTPKAAPAAKRSPSAKPARARPTPSPKAR